MDTKKHNVEDIKKHALEVMKQAGFAVTTDVAVEVDKDLPYMGYTTERNGKIVIVVSGKALDSGGAANLLIHELSHVYRSQQGHPSHDYQLLTSLAAWVMHGKVVYPYQEKIIHTILNHLQDLYADDISFKVFAKLTPIQNLNEFFLEWVHMPTSKASTSEKIWENAEALLSTAFADANLKRHNVSDTGDKMATAVKTFLAKSDKRLVAKYVFFRDFMINLPEKVTEKEFEKLLIQYLSEFLKLTKLS